MNGHRRASRAPLSTLPPPVARGLVAVVVIGLLVGCGRKEHPHTEHARKADAAIVVPLKAKVAEPTLYNALDGKTRATLHVGVVTTKNTHGYTWLQVKDGSGQGWVAAPMLRVPAGAAVEVRDYVPSAEIDPDVVHGHVPTVLFATMIRGPKVEMVPAGEHAAIHPMLPAGGVTATDLTDDRPAFAKADHDIAELHIRRGELQGRVVAVRGQVVRVAPAIAGRHALFVRDGSGDLQTGILAAMCAQAAEPGEVIELVGRLEVDKRFPHGGVHRVLLTGAVRAHGDIEAARERVTAAQAAPPAAPAAPAAATPTQATEQP